MNHFANKNRYVNMTYNRCGVSGLKLPAISLGLWHNFGGVDIFENMRKIILTAFDTGVTHFDLANNYGPPPGSSEANFGRILNTDLANHRDELIISTKAGYLMWNGPYGEWGSRKYMVSSLNQSLKRMSIDYVDIFYSHRYDPNTPLEETMGALDFAVRQGKALYAGVSNYPADETWRAAEILKELGTPCLIHQPKYSMLDRWVEPELLSVLEKEGIGCIAFSPLAQGLLTNRYLSGIPSDSRAAKPHGFLNPNQITDTIVRKVTGLNQIAQGRKQSLAQMAIAWLLKDKRITSVLVGASSHIQLMDSLKALDYTHFSDIELNNIELVLKND